MADVNQADWSVLPVLRYHSVRPATESGACPLTVPACRLREHLTALLDDGYRLVGLSEALDLLDGGYRGRVAALTFDDGFASVLRHAVPVLGELDARATLYVPVGHVGGTADWLGPHAAAVGPLLTWGQLDDVAAAGMEIGSHGLLHHDLDLLPEEQVCREIRDSRDRLSDRYHRHIRSFCYPHGHHDRAVRSIVAGSGHDSACQGGERLYRPDLHRLAVPRLRPLAGHTGAQLRDLVRTGGGQFTPWVRQVTRPGFRVTRRALRMFGRDPH
ncbi:MAG: polysaccharide deacetylase family protein [Actinocatenispora sp.]